MYGEMSEGLTLITMYELPGFTVGMCNCSPGVTVNSSTSPWTTHTTGTGRQFLNVMAGLR